MTNGLFSLTNGNGSTHSNRPWTQQSVQQFFSRFNWDDNPPEAQQFQISPGMDSDPAARLKLTVNQFLSTINWEGNPLDFPGAASQIAIPADSMVPAATDLFTLEDFSDLF